MNQRKTKADMQLIDFGADRPHKKRALATEKSTKGKKHKTQELQMIGARPGNRQRKDVIRADVVTNLDIIGEEAETCQRKRRIAQIRLNEKERRRKKKRKKAVLMRVMLGICIVIMIAAIALLIKAICSVAVTERAIDSVGDIFLKKSKVTQPEMTEELLEVNEYSRPGEALGKVKKIFVHYTANPGTTAEQNRNYFQGLADSGETSASAHFVIGYEGEILQCIPLEEIGYAVAEHNYDSVSIECCYQEEDGHFTEATYESLLHLTAWLMEKYKLTTEDVLRHYDASGKLCPKYYVEHPEAWDTFKVDLENYIEKCENM